MPIFLSELHLSEGPRRTYEVVLAAPGASRSDIHFHIGEDRVLRVSNTPSPVARDVYTYAVDAQEGVPIFSHASLKAPIIGHRRHGERLPGYAPIHFWVALLSGEGWVRVAQDPGKACGLTALGRPPLGARDVGSERGFARYLILPEDADIESASGRLERGFFTIQMGRLEAAPLSSAGDLPTTDKTDNLSNSRLTT